MCITDICMTEINFKAMFFDILKKIKIKFASDSQWNLTQLRTYNGEMHKLIECQFFGINEHFDEHFSFCTQRRCIEFSFVTF